MVGGQGTDDLSVVGSLTGSVVSGNLGNDTMKLDEVIKSSSIYGGGGFVYDTSLDGADSIAITGLSPPRLFRPTVAMTAFTSAVLSKTAPFTAVKVLI